MENKRYVYIGIGGIIAVCFMFPTMVLEWFGMREWFWFTGVFGINAWLAFVWLLTISVPISIVILNLAKKKSVDRTNLILFAVAIVSVFAIYPLVMKGVFLNVHTPGVVYDWPDVILRLSGGGIAAGIFAIIGLCFSIWAYVEDGNQKKEREYEENLSGSLQAASPTPDEDVGINKDLKINKDKKITPTPKVHSK